MITKPQHIRAMGRWGPIVFIRFCFVRVVRVAFRASASVNMHRNLSLMIITYSEFHCRLDTLRALHGTKGLTPITNIHKISTLHSPGLHCISKIVPKCKALPPVSSWSMRVCCLLMMGSLVAHISRMPWLCLIKRLTMNLLGFGLLRVDATIHIAHI